MLCEYFMGGAQCAMIASILLASSVVFLDTNFLSSQDVPSKCHCYFSMWATPHESGGCCSMLATADLSTLTISS